ncbi:MAG TPA: hypothetical protein VHX65_06950 [Pirellulales bacterium]|jgi:hypothetical protein|nr:hypothetical protein [Pirellulales bacterium]
MNRFLLAAMATIGILIALAVQGRVAAEPQSSDASKSANTAANENARSPKSASEAAETPKPGTPKPGRSTFDKTDQYDVQRIEGWKVLVNKKFRPATPDVYEKTIKQLSVQLYNITRIVPEPALGKIRQVPIWVELFEKHTPCMAYHPDAGWLTEHGMNPDKARCVELANARNFLIWTLDQPWMVLHELSHGYHDRFLPDGYENAEVRAAYKHAMDEKLYDAVLRRGFKVERAYAATNPMEYFAESSEAFFGTNDFYPFVNAELRKHDPVGYDMERHAWGITTEDFPR